MPNKLLVVAYNLSGIDNHAYFFDGAPDSLFCKKCGCYLDENYTPKNFKTNNKADFSATYDGRFLSSKKFKEYIEALDYDVDFSPVNEENSLFQMMPRKIVEFAAHQKENLCEECHQYFDQVAPRPDFFYKTKKTLSEGIFATSISFGSGKEKSPSIVLGIKTANIIKDAVKRFKFRGVDISAIYAKAD